MRNYYNVGGPTLVGKQNKLPPALKKKILAAKKKKINMMMHAVKVWQYV